MATRIEGKRLVWSFDAEILIIEAWGRDGLRVRATERGRIDETEDWALLRDERGQAILQADGDTGSISNGAIGACIREGERIEFLNARGEIALEERMRVRGPGRKEFDSTEVRAREYRPTPGGGFRIAQRFEAVDGEMLFGMGQYQDGRLDLKGSVLELAQRNSQASVPFSFRAAATASYGTTPPSGARVSRPI